MTVDQIIEETRHGPPERVAELLDRLTEDMHGSDPEVDAAWETEIARRIEEIRTGRVKGIPVEESLTRIGKIVGR